ncbi:MAG: hypothetical protein D6785_01580, partial [Planctomycetota bacterium]
MKNQTIHNRYKIIRELGKGGMGEVYLVKDLLRDGEELALKMLFTGSLSPANLEFFKYEFKVLTELSHPNLVKVYDYGTIQKEKRHFFTSQFVDGCDLFMATQNASLSEIYDIFVQILRGLAYIHSKGIIHHDIKVNNILVTRNRPRQAKIVDFGLVGEHRLQEKKTNSKTIRGTLGYLAPELIQGTKVDHRIDLYALGITFYFILTRRLPYESPSATDVLRQHLFKRPISIRELNPKVPPGLERIVLKLMEKKAERRYLSANQVIEDLAKVSDRAYEIETKETTSSYILSGRFVEREKEMALLTERCESLFQPLDKKGNLLSLPPSLTVVSGMAGVGKSRLLREFKIEVQLKEWSYFEGEATSGLNLAFQPFLSIFRNLIPFLMGENPTQGQRLLNRYGSELYPFLPSLLKNYDVLPPRSSGNESIDRARRLDFLAYFLLEAARIHPMILAIDSLHWADEASLELVDKIVENLALQRKAAQAYQLLGEKIPPDLLSPLFLVLAYRPEDLEEGVAHPFLKKWKEKKLCTTIPLENLSHKGLEELLLSILPGLEDSQRWTQTLLEKGGGNPYLTEQMLLYLAEEGKILRSGQKWKLSSEASFTSLPETVHEVLSKRLEKLNPSEQEVITLLSFFKEPITLDFFCRIWGKKQNQIHHIFRELEKKQILCRIQKEGKFFYDFLHGITKEMVYEEIPENQQKELHGKIGSQLEKLFSEKKEEVLEELAYHFLRSNEVGKALEYAYQAGIKNRR